MKQLLNLICFLAFSFSSYGQYPDATTIKKNKIRIIGVSGLSGTVYRLYDENGMGVKGSYMDEEFKTTEWENKIFYNQKSLPDSIHSTGYRKSKTYYKYAADGSYTIIELEGASMDTSLYDKDNKIKERRSSDGSKTKYEYNTKRQLIKGTETKGGDKSITTYTYNASGFLQSTKTTGASTGSADYTYDKKGLLIKEVNDYGIGSKTTTTYFYKFREPLPALGKVKATSLPPSFVLSESAMTVNGASFDAQKMLAENLFRSLGEPEKVDTLNDKQITNFIYLEMARINKYNSAGVLLKQGRQTSRINDINIFINPEAGKKFVDYINTGFKGKLTILGLKIDTNTSVKQLQAAYAKYELDVSEEFKVADMTVYDKNTNARLLEIKFRLSASLQKIEYIEFRYFPNEPLKKQKMEYRDRELFLDGLLLDSSAGKSIAIKKILGAPNGVFDYDYRMGSKIIKVKEYIYRSIRGISFIENPANNSLIYLKIDFLSLRKKSDLANPLISFIINGKTFDPEKPVIRSQNEIKSIFSFDSIGRVSDKTANKAIVTAYEPNGNLSFEFDGDLDWYKRVYYFSYNLKQPASMPVIETVVQLPAPAFFINSGKVWITVKGKTIYWDFGAEAKSKFFAALGSPSKILNNRVSEFAEYGFRVWVNSDGLEELLIFLTPIKNAISGKEQSPGIFKGTVEIEGKKITQEMTFEEINSLLPDYNLLKQAYTDATEINYVGRNNGVKIYMTFHKSSGKLADLAISRK